MEYSTNCTKDEAQSNQSSKKYPERSGPWLLHSGINGQEWGITSDPPLSAHLDFPRLPEHKNRSGAAQGQSGDPDFAEE